MKNILSIDWEDWFHVCEAEHVYPRSQWDGLPSILDEATDRVLDLLDRKGARCTFFMLGYCAERHPELVARIAREGHEIGYHSYGHDLVYQTRPPAFAEDLRHGRRLLQELSGQTVAGFRAPQWSLNHKAEWAVDQLVKAGFAYDSSRAPLPIVGRSSFPETVHALRAGQDGGRLLELPPLVLKSPFCNLPAGGGWGLRTWPQSAIIGKAGRLNALGSPATFFFHPADFVGRRKDSRLPWRKRFVLHFGLRGIERIWETLFDCLQLTSAAEALAELGLEREKVTA